MSTTSSGVRFSKSSSWMGDPESSCDTCVGGEDSVKAISTNLIGSWRS